MAIISRSEFLVLYEEILKKCEAESGVDFSDTKYKSASKFGFNGFEYKENHHSIIRLILRNTKVQLFLTELNYKWKKIDGKHLYRLHLDFVKHKKKDAQLRGIYRKLYFIFLDCSDLEEFKHKYISASDRLNLLLNYSCYYFSFKSYKVKTFNLSIDYHETPYKCSIEGLHDKHNNNAKDKIYHGFAQEKRRCLFMKLEANDGDELNLIAYLGNMNPLNMDILACTFQAVSAHGYPIAGEALITRLNPNLSQIFSPDEKDNIFYYLMMQRRMYRIPTRISQNLNELQAMRHVANEVKHLRGIYRIWSLDRSKNIVQSKFTIKNDFRAFLEVPEANNPNQHKQTCLLSVNNVNGMKLCVTAHESRGTSLINFAIIDFPSSKSTIFTRGVFSGVGIARRHSSQLPITGYIALLKENEEFSPKKLTKKEQRLLIESNSKYEIFYNNLLSLTKL